jgi:hypothetical protein
MGELYQLSPPARIHSVVIKHRDKFTLLYHVIMHKNVDLLVTNYTGGGADTR